VGIALLVGLGTLLVRLLFYGVAMYLLQLVVRLVRTGFAGLVFRKNVAASAGGAAQSAARVPYIY
jgi:hypothetical protein